MSAIVAVAMDLAVKLNAAMFYYGACYTHGGKNTVTVEISDFVGSVVLQVVMVVVVCDDDDDDS